MRLICINCANSGLKIFANKPTESRDVINRVSTFPLEGGNRDKGDKGDEGDNF